MKWSERLGFSRRKVKTDGKWLKCKNCDKTVYRKQLDDNQGVCPECDYYFTLSPEQRIEQLTDEGTFQELDVELKSADPLKFEAANSTYISKYEQAIEKTGNNEAFVFGTAKVEGKPFVLGIMDFGFMGGSMGSVLGEKVTRAIEKATQEKCMLVIVCASGGARMQEGALSLMQMAKSSAALARHQKANLPFISILTNPTMGGVSASFATLGDVIIAEPNALIGFAGPRVIEQTFKRKLPEGFQRSEYLLEHGHIDMIVKRTELKGMIATLTNYLTAE